MMLLRLIIMASHTRFLTVPALQRNWLGRAHRPVAAALPPCQSAARPDRDADRSLEAGQAELGSPEDPGKIGPALSRRAYAGDQHGACGARSPWPGQASNQAPQ